MADKSVLNGVKIVKTEVEKVTEDHETPWLKNWTIHEIEVSDDEDNNIAENISNALDCSRAKWYVDFKDVNSHYVIFYQQVFHINRTKKEYDRVRSYGIRLGIPEHQLDFSPDI